MFSNGTLLTFESFGGIEFDMVCFGGWDWNDKMEIDLVKEGVVAELEALDAQCNQCGGVD